MQITEVGVLNEEQPLQRARKDREPQPAVAGPRLPVITPGGTHRTGPRQRAGNSPRQGRIGTHGSGANHSVGTHGSGANHFLGTHGSGANHFFQLVQERTATIAFGTVNLPLEQASR